ncbi:hypothetical protein [Maribacter stanieri]|uniref:hypothetical protein n=1 Tax=Maribacter stanieri TaxID=440514 RepID=UPI0030DC852A
MKGICALYDNETELMESHIFPKFIIKNTKKTGSQYLRRVIEPNKREQDGPKSYLLSFKAEQEFAKREKWFAEKIYVPYLSGKKYFKYDDNLYYFSISFLWRTLIFQLKTEPTLKKDWTYNTLLKVEKEWKEFLKTNKKPKKYHNVNLLFTSRIESHSTELNGVDYYTSRALDATIVDNQNHTFILIYAKFNRFIFWSVVKSPEYQDELYEVEINPKEGVLEVPQDVVYQPINSFIANRIKKIAEFPRPNQSEQDKIEKEIMKNPEKFWNSDAGQSLYNDNFNLKK